jgi:hypothetical protein
MIPEWIGLETIFTPEELVETFFVGTFCHDPCIKVVAALYLKPWKRPD